MNPLGAFSFGKIIKTFLPGTIASLSFVFVVELIYQWDNSFSYSSFTSIGKSLLKQSFLFNEVLSGAVTAAASGTIMLILSLVLGFLTNTALWMFANKTLRSCADKYVSRDAKEARQDLERLADNCMGECIPDERRDTNRSMSDIPLQIFYLPALDQTKLANIHESYFSWFEFQTNAASALTMSIVTYFVCSSALFYHHSIGCLFSFFYIALPLIAVIAITILLLCAAVKNLARYREYLIWFIVGTFKLRELNKR